MRNARKEQMTIVTSLLMLGRRNTGVKQDVFSPLIDLTIGDIPFIRKANPRYVDISFLGAHDANTGISTRGAELEPATSDALKKAEPFLRNYLYRYVKTQTATVYDLLQYGCRFLHIKVTRAHGTFYTSHSVLTGELKTHVLDLLRFLSERKHAGEIVSVLFQCIDLSDLCFADLHDFLAGISYDGKTLYDYVHYAPVDEFGRGEGIKIGNLRYDDIVSDNGENGVVLFQRRDKHYLSSWDKRKTDYPFFFDMDANALHVWHDHSNVRLLDKDIDELTYKILSSDKYDDLLRMNQTQSSSSFRTIPDVLASIYSRSLLKTAEKHNLKLLEKKNLSDMLKAMPVFQVDYLTSGYGDFNRRINEAIRSYNEKLVQDLL